MLDAFLEVAHQKTKQAEAAENTRRLLEKLPRSVLAKVASGEIQIGKSASECNWLDQFRDSPLLEQAVAIEREDLEVQMDEARRRQAETEMRSQMPSWDETDLRRQQVSIKRKLLELELAGAGLDAMGGQEGEDAFPADMEEAGAEETPELQQPKAAPVVPEELPPAGEGEAPPVDAKPKEEKPKTEKTTTVTKEKPVDEKEKIDVKQAASRMRAKLASLKEAQPANGARPFQEVKEAGVVKSTNSIGRGLQLLTGSRARALESQAANRGQALARNVASSNRTMKAAVFDSGVSEGKAQRALRSGERAVQTARGGQQRAARLATQERAAVQNARSNAMAAAGALGVGAGGVTLARNKMAGVADGLAATVAAGSQKIRQATSAVQKQVVKNNTPLLSQRQKLMAGGLAAGVGAGALMSRGQRKTAGELEKDAFGAAVMQGIKGIGQFAQTAGKGIMAAGKSGGLHAAGQAAGNAGRAGLMRAGNFIAQNPGAGAALVAAPAAAVGYAAGRQ